jgi:hypothetical protein
VAFLERHCTSCHGAEKQKGNLSLHKIQDEASLLRARRHWKDVLEMVESGEMPPTDKPQPTPQERKQFLTAAMAVLPRPTTVRRSRSHDRCGG